MRTRGEQLREWLRRFHDRWLEDYEEYARMRGFRTFNDWPYHRRGFIECWAEPGFHRFWQVWNPGIGYFVHRLFPLLGGRRRWVFPTIAAFTINGSVHTLVVAPFLGRWAWSFIAATACFGLLTVLSRLGARALRQPRWPWPLNAALNVGLVVGSFDIGFRVDRLLLEL